MELIKRKMLCEKCKKDKDVRFSIQKFFYSKNRDLTGKIKFNTLELGMDVKVCQECAIELFGKSNTYQQKLEIISKKYQEICKLVYNTIDHLESILPNEHISKILKEKNYFDGFYEILKIIDEV